MSGYAQVRNGSKTEVSGLARHVRFTLRCRHRQPAPACPFGANGRHPRLGLIRKRRPTEAAGTKWSALVTPTAAHPPDAPLEGPPVQQVFSAFLIGSDPGYFAGR